LRAQSDQESDNEEEPELGHCSLSLLRDPNIFIGYTSATADVTHDKAGCIDEQENCALSVGIEGEGLKCVSQVNLPGIIWDKHGHEKQHVTFRKYRYNPKASFNLLSLMNLLIDGWAITGDANAIMMRKGNAEIRFDIIIRSERGAIFATYVKSRDVPEMQGGM